MTTSLIEAPLALYSEAPAQLTPGAERNAYDPTIVINNESFLSLMKNICPDGDTRWDEKATSLLNTMLAGNPSLIVQLDPSEEGRPWVHAFRTSPGYTEEESGIVHKSHPRDENAITRRLVFSEITPEMRERAVTIVDSTRFNESVMEFAAKHITNPNDPKDVGNAFDDEAYAFLVAALEGSRKNIVLSFPEIEKFRPWMQKFRKHCEQTGSTAMDRVIFVSAPTQSDHSAAT